MHHASSASIGTSGYWLPEDSYEQLRDLIDELQLLVALTATGRALDDEVVPLGFKRASLAGYLRRVAKRIAAALESCGYTAERGNQEVAL